MSNKELLLKINNNMLLVLEKINAMEKRLNNIEMNGISKKKINWIEHLKINFPDENNFQFIDFSKINIDTEEMWSLYKKQINMKDLISLKIDRNIHKFEGIKSFSKNKNTFIKLNNEWKIIDDDNIISIITWIKIACFNCTKSCPRKTENEEEFVNNVDKTISRDITDILITNTKKAIYNAVKEDL